MKDFCLNGLRDDPLLRIHFYHGLNPSWKYGLILVFTRHTLLNTSLLSESHPLWKTPPPIGKGSFQRWVRQLWQPCLGWLATDEMSEGTPVSGNFTQLPGHMEGCGVLSECARCEGAVQGAVNTAPFLTLPDRETCRYRPAETGSRTIT